MLYSLCSSDFNSLVKPRSNPVLSTEGGGGEEGQCRVLDGPGVRYISTILTINIETVKLFHVRTDRRTGL